MATQDELRRELQGLSPAQLRELLSASGHAQLLREEETPHAVDAQLVSAAKDEGNALFRQGHMEAAISAYSRSLDDVIDDISTAIAFLTALCCFAFRCLEMDPSNALCRSNRAAAYLKLKQFDLAAADCTKAIDVTPTIKSFMRRATAYIALQQYGQAVADLIAALVFELRNKECREKLRAIVDTATDGKQCGGEELRKAGACAASVLSGCDGWVKSSVRGNPGPAAVNGHTLFRGDNDRIYLFGGRAVREQKPDVFVLDESDDSRWDIVPTGGAATPSSRAWHSTSAIGSKGSGCYCVYGGVSSRGEDSSVHLLIPTSPRGFQWVQPRCLQEAHQIPAPRSGHAAVSVTEVNGDRVVFLFGGRTKRGVSDQLLILRCSSTPINGDTEANHATVAWEEIHPDDSAEARLSWPSARDGHSMCLLESTEHHPSRFVLFGGNGQLNDDRMNDVWLFDLEKQLWTLFQCSGDIPSPRSYHTAHTIGEYLFVIGGRTAEAEDNSVYMLDIGASKWFKVPIPNDHALAPRAWHSSVLAESGKLFVLGGGTYHGPLKDAATLDFGYFRSKAPSLSRVPVDNKTTT